MLAAFTAAPCLVLPRRALAGAAAAVFLRPAIPAVGLAPPPEVPR